MVMSLKPEDKFIDVLEIFFMSTSWTAVKRGEKDNKRSCDQAFLRVLIVELNIIAFLSVKDAIWSRFLVKASNENGLLFKNADL